MARARLIEETSHENFGNKGGRGETMVGIPHPIQVQIAGEPSRNQSSGR